MARRKKKKSKILFVLEIAVLLIFIGGLFVYGQINNKLDKITVPEVENFDKEEIVVNIPESELKGYTNIALFALDKRAKTGSAGGENSDTVIICSINNDTKEVRLASIYRDTLLNIGGDTYQKCNAAYAYGGPQQALSMLNSNLDLNIQNFVTVDFRAMVRAIDMLGGLDIPLTYQEMVHMNNYCVETGEETETDYVPLELPDPKPEDETKILGEYHLSGVQATSYCRIRYTASLDMGRTERQRFVIQKMVEKAKKSSITTLSNILDEVIPYVETSFSKSEILKLAMGMLSYKITDTTGFPECYRFADIPSKGSVIVPATLETNANALHYFLFPTEGYVPSDEVHRMSEIIIGLTGYGVNGEIVSADAMQNMINALESDETYGIYQSAPDQSYTVITDWNTTPSTPNYTYTPDPNPGYTDPGYTDPGYTNPSYTNPGYTDPGYTEPGFDNGSGGDVYADPFSQDFSADASFSNDVASDMSIVEKPVF